MNQTTAMIIDVTDQRFADDVIRRSHQVPVIVDFWASWCGPCRTLGPMLEAAVTARNGDIVLAKVDVDANQAVAAQMGVQGIPQVFAFKDGTVVDQFTGVIPGPQLEAFIDRLVPSATDLALAEAASLDDSARIAALRDVVAGDPSHKAAAIALADALVDDHPDEALELIAPHRPDPTAEQIVAKAGLAGHRDIDLDALRSEFEAGDHSRAAALGGALSARGLHDEAITVLLAAVRAGGEAREQARTQLLALFAVLGEDDPRVGEARRQLAAALF